MDSATIWNIIDTYFQDNPQALVRHHIDSYNDFFKNGIKSIFKDNSATVVEQRFKDFLRKSDLFTKRIKPFVLKVFFKETL